MTVPIKRRTPRHRTGLELSETARDWFLDRPPKPDAKVWELFDLDFSPGVRLDAGKLWAEFGAGLIEEFEQENGPGQRPDYYRRQLREGGGKNES